MAQNMISNYVRNERGRDSLRVNHEYNRDVKESIPIGSPTCNSIGVELAGILKKREDEICKLKLAHRESKSKIEVLKQQLDSCLKENEYLQRELQKAKDSGGSVDRTYRRTQCCTPSPRQEAEYILVSLSLPLPLPLSILLSVLLPLSIPL
ncbi:hypothetical protein CFO_g4160 [Ceratocystis platani]|uniref:Uncharacterized protein n=1 Tax=Ceratocystis fimbriata f. sp. platani TaxID=88771 RepID=A0A0F8BM46_CERFI|nr:hypothetical protein CFO_g4160 [Ceratocystis platani]